MRKTKAIISLLVTLLIIFSYLGTQQEVATKPKADVQGIQKLPTPTSLPITLEEAQIIKVVDGDTISVMLDGKKQTIRIIGIDTPETVDPRKPVQCYGKAASDRAKELLSNKTVWLESDPSQGNMDKYGRLLRYVFIKGSDDYGLGAILEGYAHEYTYSQPYKYQEEYKKAENAAKNAQVGLWADEACLIK
jgi:micrococcal nuclease